MYKTNKTLIIAEIAQAHEGSFNQCFAFIDAAKECGVDAIKFQTHIAQAESTPKEEWRKKFSFKDETRFEYWQRMGFSASEWKQLKEYTHKKGLYFISSPFSEEAVDLLLDINLDFWKVASGEVLSYSMLDKMIKSKKHIFISTGMSSWDEIDEFVGYLKYHKASFTLLQCSTAYPTTPKVLGLNIIKEMQSRYHCQIGLSDHSGEIYPSLAAVSLGAKAIEIHFTLSKKMFGPDISSSLDCTQLIDLVKGIRYLDEALANPLNKDAFSSRNERNHSLFYKRALAVKEIACGCEIKKEDFEFKKPQENGIPELEFRAYVGQKVVRNLSAGEPLEHNCFSDETNKKVQKKLYTDRNKYKKCAIKKEKYV